MTIWAPHQAFYIQAMLFNSESATRSVQHFNSVIDVVLENSPEDPLSAIPVHDLLSHLQNVVMQAAALSRYFWPVRNAHAERGTELRRALRVGDDSPLRSRDLRNAIEHFDERLDAFLAGGLVGHILPEYVGPLVESRDVPVHLFRAYYLDVGVFELLGRRYEMNPIAIEVGRVHELLRKMNSEGGVFGR